MGCLVDGLRATPSTRGQPTTARGRLPLQDQRDTGADHGRTDGRAHRHAAAFNINTNTPAARRWT